MGIEQLTFVYPWMQLGRCISSIKEFYYIYDWNSCSDVGSRGRALHFQSEELGFKSCWRPVIFIFASYWFSFFVSFLLETRQVKIFRSLVVGSFVFNYLLQLIPPLIWKGFESRSKSFTHASVHSATRPLSHSPYRSSSIKLQKALIRSKIELPADAVCNCSMLSDRQAINSHSQRLGVNIIKLY